MEIQEVERPFREIDISQVGPIIINSLTQINLDTGCIGKPGDLFFSPIKYDYIPNTRLTITMSEPFILDIKKAAIRNTRRLVRAGLRRWSYIPLRHA